MPPFARNWLGERAGDESTSTAAAVAVAVAAAAAACEQIRSGCLKEKSAPKSSERKRDTLWFKAKETGTL